MKNSQGVTIIIIVYWELSKKLKFYLTTIGITVTLMFYNFLSSLARSKYLWCAATVSSLTFLFIITRSGLLARIRFFFLFIHLSFSHQRHLMVFHWTLRDSKSPQVSRTLLSILAVLNNIVVWMVSTRPLTSKSSSPFSNPLVTVPNAPITIGIIVTCMFHSFSILLQSRGTCPSFHF